MRIVVLLLLLAYSSQIGWAQKRELEKQAKFWTDAELPVDRKGAVNYAGSFYVQQPEELLYSKAEEWIILNNRGPHNKWILKDPEINKLIFQREFNYFFEGIEDTPAEDNQKIVFTTVLQINEGVIEYEFYDFRHDHRGTLMSLNPYLKQTDPARVERIESQIIKFIEGYWSEGIEHYGYTDTLSRVLGSDESKPSHSPKEK